MKLKSPIFRSLILHATIVAMLLFAIYWDYRNTRTEVPITLEHISLSDKMKKALHSAIHTMGLPHHEPENLKSAVQSAPSQATESNSLEESAGGTIPPNEMQKYMLEVVARINRVKQYPKEAQFNEQEGIVTVMLEVAPDGNVIKTELEKGAAFESLNRAAMAAIQKLGTLPPLPPRASGTPPTKPIQLHIPIHFQLK